MRVHFISIGGSVMHSLAMVLKNRGEQVTGSDDTIYEPSLTRLKQAGLLPDPFGWFPEKITADTHLVILGMHGKKDNPELLKALSLGIPIFSFPEFIYRETVNKKRVVIAGSHGKTTITTLIMHVLKTFGKDYDYMAGAGMAGFDNMVKLTDRSDLMVLEGDEYFSSALDPTPKFLHYHHDIGLLSGIAWDHFNAFPTFSSYRAPFEKFIRNTREGGSLIYNGEDQQVVELAEQTRISGTKISYQSFPYRVSENQVIIHFDNLEFPVRLIGFHNVQNISAAVAVLKVLGFNEKDSLAAIASFGGARNRLELVLNRERFNVFRDFAHAPSKVRASVNAVKETYPGKKLVAILELHTYSSLHVDFIPQYKDSLKSADQRIIYLDGHAMAIKGIRAVPDEVIHNGFNDPAIQVIRDKENLVRELKNSGQDTINFLFMSSGSFSGLDINNIFN